MAIGVDMLPRFLVIVGGLVWGIRLEGKVKAHDQLFVERDKQVTQWLDDHEERDKERHGDIKEDLKEIKETLKTSTGEQASLMIAAAVKAATESATITVLNTLSKIKDATHV